MLRMNLLIILRSKDFVFCNLIFSWLPTYLSRNVNLNVFFFFIIEFVWLKSLMTKQKLRTKFIIFIVQLGNMILPRIFKGIFYSF